MLPAPDATLLARRAFGFDRAISADVRPCRNTNAIWLSLNFDAFMAPSPGPVSTRTQNWKILAQIGPVCGGQVKAVTGNQGEPFTCVRNGRE